MMTTLDPPATRAPRHAMVASQLRPNAVTDERIVAAMAAIPRERFLPADVRAIAYIDRSIPVGRGRGVNPPLATARLLTQAELEPQDRVLLIGASGGYAAAVLAEIVAHVTALESDPALVAIAREALMGVGNVDLAEGPLPQGWAVGAPYDVLVVDGAIEELPVGLVEQVRPGGRIVTGLAERGVTRLAAGRRTGGGFGLIAFADAECVVLPGFARPVAFRF
jgi:protein-L-isoaspartate(D-aspartate) O-methyltransferase